MMASHGPELRQNPLDTHGEIRWTVSGPDSRTLASLPIRSANSSRSAVRNGERPAETTTNGSSATTSVHSAGRFPTSPASSKKKTRSSCQDLTRFTNSNDRPNSGWNRCVTRTRRGDCSTPPPRVVDDTVEQPGGGVRPPGQGAATHLRRRLAHPARTRRLRDRAVLPRHRPQMGHRQTRRPPPTVHNRPVAPPSTDPS